MSFLPTATVYGTLLNFRRERELLGDRMAASPYNAPPRSPVLYIKPANTWTANGRSIVLPAGADAVWVGATVALLIGPAAADAGAAPATLERVAGYVLLNDLSLPQPNLFRPPVKYNCADGLLGIGPGVLAASANVDARDFRLEVRIDGELRQTVEFSGLVRDPARLIEDVSEFMTLREGDLLMLGCDVLPDGARLGARAGQRIGISGAPHFDAPLMHALTVEAVQ